jgi:hypothetical protein
MDNFRRATSASPVWALLELDLDPRDVLPPMKSARRRRVPSSGSSSRYHWRMSRGLRHLALRTRDLPRTEQFYRDVIGLRRAFNHA